MFPERIRHSRITDFGSMRITPVAKFLYKSYYLFLISLINGLCLLQFNRVASRHFIRVVGGSRYG
jgi:hypothetical protein